MGSLQSETDHGDQTSASSQPFSPKVGKAAQAPPWGPAALFTATAAQHHGDVPAIRRPLDPPQIKAVFGEGPRLATEGVFVQKERLWREAAKDAHQSQCGLEAATSWRHQGLGRAEGSGNN